MNPHIAICIATYHRPGQLEATLKSLPQYLPEPYTAEIRVVDNDVSRSAEHVVRVFAGSSRIPTHYSVESEQNIAAARNRAIEMGRADFLVFIDDDEFASRDWLNHLVQAAQSTHADAVIGPVIGVLPDNAPAWCIRGNWFDKPVPKDNGPLAWSGTRTSNTLVRGRWFYEHGMRFDNEYGRSGGSDVALFKQIAQRGGFFHAASEAVVYETVEPNRTRLRWLMKRFYRGGLVYQRVQSNRQPMSPLLDVARRAVKATLLGVKGAIMLPFGHTDDLVRVATTSALLCGGLRAWLGPDDGARYVEYASHENEAA